MARMSKEELADVGKWSNKSQASKGGTVNHVLSDAAKETYENMKKYCGCPMGQRCGCKECQ